MYIIWCTPNNFFIRLTQNVNIFNWVSYLNFDDLKLINLNWSFAFYEMMIRFPERNTRPEGISRWSHGFNNQNKKLISILCYFIYVITLPMFCVLRVCALRNPGPLTHLIYFLVEIFSLIPVNKRHWQKTIIIFLLNSQLQIIAQLIFVWFVSVNGKKWSLNITALELRSHRTFLTSVFLNLRLTI